jgi:hypothetical protein
VNHDLHLVVRALEECGLAKEEIVRLLRVPPHCTSGWSRSGTLEEDHARCSGTDSLHSFSAEFSSAMMFCSHSWPTNPRETLDLLIEYYHQVVSGTTSQAFHSNHAHDSAQGERDDLLELEVADKVRHV